jgi:AcrR family transcriptional regulator
MGKKLKTKEKIKKTALMLFNENDTISITTNHIAKDAKISPGNLYYYYKNKEEIITDLYLQMSNEFEEFNSFKLIAHANNPLEVLSQMYDNYGNLFFKYKFLIRDIGALLALYPNLKELFSQRQNKRLAQIESLLNYFLELDIIQIEKEDIPLTAKLNWFIPTYWQLFTSVDGNISHDSINEVKHIVFTILLKPILTKKGQELLEQIQ